MVESLKNKSPTTRFAEIPADTPEAKKSAGNKWVVNCSQGELQSIAIMVRHKTYAKNEVVKAVDFQSKGVFKTVAEIERLTGHTFFPNVPNVPKDTYNPGDWNF